MIKQSKSDKICLFIYYLLSALIKFAQKLAIIAWRSDLKLSFQICVFVVARPRQLIQETSSLMNISIFRSTDSASLNEVLRFYALYKTACSRKGPLNSPVHHLLPVEWCWDSEIFLQLNICAYASWFYNFKGCSNFQDVFAGPKKRYKLYTWRET